MIINDHKVVLDKERKIISWITPQSKAYDQFLHQRWNFVKTGVPNYPGTSYPEYYFSCGYNNQNFGEPSTWMNDVGEKIPNWFESARLYYAYTVGKLQYTATDNIGTEYLRLAFNPTRIMLNGTTISLSSDNNEGYTLKNLGNNNYAITIKRRKAGNIIVTGLPTQLK
jgi:hypothetical protein